MNASGLWQNAAGLFDAGLRQARQAFGGCEAAGGMSDHASRFALLIDGRPPAIGRGLRAE